MTFPDRTLELLAMEKQADQAYAEGSYLEAATLYGHVFQHLTAGVQCLSAIANKQMKAYLKIQEAKDENSKKQRD